MSPSARVLTIDDEYVLRQSIVAYLEDSGFVVYEAENGRVGLEIFREKKPDLVLTDLQMPEMGGLEVLATITKESPATPVLVVSGAGALNDVIEALRLGAWDYLTKPVTDLAVLEHAICKALERSRLIEENRKYREEMEIKTQALQKNLDTLEEDQKAGRSVQLRLLPDQGATYDGYQFNFRVFPSLYLSGDFIDFFRIDTQKLGFYIADVSGHGASSAFVTVLLRSIVQQMLMQYQTGGGQTILDPAHLLSELALEIHSAKLGKYLTMVYGVIDTQKHSCTYSVGGHYPNPILLEGNNTYYMPGKGFPVGIMKETHYQKHVIQLAPGSHLFMTTDGIMEILPQIELEQRETTLMAMVAASDGKAEALELSLGLIEGKPLPDDVTFLVLKRLTT